MIKRIVFLFTIGCQFSFPLVCQAQIMIKGLVTDTFNRALPFINIYINQNDTSSILAFGSSNDKGYFSFESPALNNNFIITASGLGYEAQRKKIENNTKNIIEVNFLLTPKEFVLKETIVRGSNKIIQKNDTITFNADKFRDSTEQNLEELLAKIPGVDVDKNTGIITVQGKPIKKILIEGDDLTGRNYQLMSKNMSADVVDKIQIIDKFTENKLLKGLKRSDDKVINITLKENRKKLLFGNALLGLGNDERTNNSINLFGFYKKLKTISFGNFNTIGQVSTADRMLSADYKEDSGADEQHSLLNSRNTSIIDIGRTPSVSLNSQSVRFNRATLASTHFTVQPSESIRLKGAFTFSNDRVRSFVDNDYQYLLKDTLFSLSELNTIQRKPTILEGHLDAQIDLSSRSLLRYKGDIRQSLSNNSNQTISNNNNIFNQLNNKTFAYSNSIDFTYRLNDFQAITLNTVFISDNNEETFKLNQSIPRYIPSVLLPSDSLVQSIRNPLKYFALNGQWLYAKNTFKISTYLGYVNKNDNLTSSLNGFYQNTSLFFSDTFNNNFKNQQNNYYIGLNIKEDWLNIQWFSDISGGYYKSVLENKLNKKDFYLLPIIGFRKKIKEKHSLFGTYAFNMSLPKTVDLTNGYILSDYRSLERGASIFIPANSHTSILNYSYGNFSDEFLAHFNIISSINKKGYRNDITINPSFNISSKVINNFSNSNTIISSSIERYMPQLYMRLKVRPSVSFSNYQNTLNGSDIRETNAVNSTIDISLRSAYLKWFNFHLGTTLNQSNINTGLNKTTTNIKNQSIGSFLDFYLKFNDRLNGKIENEVFYVKQSNNIGQRYYFINASVRYEIIETRLSANLTAKNLLNTKEFINTYTTDYSTQINRVQLLPRYLLLEMNFRF